jgi:hypothetical protein
VSRRWPRSSTPRSRRFAPVLWIEAPTRICSRRAHPEGA